MAQMQTMQSERYSSRLSGLTTPLPCSEPAVAPPRRWLSARSKRLAQSRHQELPPSDRQCGFRYSLAPRPCAFLFSGLRLLALLELALDQNLTGSFGSPWFLCSWWNL